MVKNILIVDDDPQARRLLRLIIERGGFSVTEAENGFAALALLEQGIPDLCILDLMMPGMDGLKLCKALRDRSATARVPIILYSANPAWRLNKPWSDSGANDFLIKTTPPSTLIERVRRLIDASTMSANNSQNAG
jgi:DNA-binding response OmpR family regulator